MDQCHHCELKGNYEGCKAADCGKHQDWIVVEYKKRIRELEDENMRLRELVELTMKVWDYSMNAPLKDVRAWLAEAKKALGRE